MRRSHCPVDIIGRGVRNRGEDLLSGWVLDLDQLGRARLLPLSADEEVTAARENRLQIDHCGIVHRGSPSNVGLSQGNLRSGRSDPQDAKRKVRALLLLKPQGAAQYAAQSTDGRTAATRSAAATTLASSMARVMGPTPPGFGATKPATSLT